MVGTTIDTLADTYHAFQIVKQHSAITDTHVHIDRGPL